MELESVNKTISDSEFFFDSEIFLHGVLIYSKDNVLIEHWPKKERSLDGFNQVWVNTGKGIFTFNDKVLRRINKKRVVVRGVLQRNQTLWADDPGSFWCVHLLATELTEFKVWQAEHG